MAVTADTESAWTRARRDWTRSVESWWFILLTAILDAGCASVAAVIAHGQSSGVFIVLIAALIGTVGGTVSSLAVVGAVQLMRAPYRQRDEARRDLQKLRAPQGWPNIDVTLHDLYEFFSFGRLRNEYPSELHMDAVVVNRQPDTPANISFKLIGQESQGRRFVIEPQHAREYPQHVAQQRSARFRLAFTIRRDVREGLGVIRGEYDPPAPIPSQIFHLAVEDHISGETRKVELPGDVVPVKARDF